MNEEQKEQCAQEIIDLSLRPAPWQDYGKMPSVEEIIAVINKYLPAKKAKRY
jgi:hypothetical protein